MFIGLAKYNHFALLIVRIGLGVMMVLHGYPKLLGGVEKWERLGNSISVLGIDFLPVFWGFMAAFAEAIGGALLIIGWFYRPATLLLLMTMVVAALKHLNAGDGIMGASHAIELAVIFLGLFILGPGKYSIDKK